jgi:hypothetical protein
MLANEALLQEFQNFAATAPTVKSVMVRIAQRLHERMMRYNWVGFYLVDRPTPTSWSSALSSVALRPKFAFRCTPDFAGPRPAAGKS